MFTQQQPAEEHGEHRGEKRQRGHPRGRMTLNQPGVGHKPEGGRNHTQIDNGDDEAGREEKRLVRLKHPGEEGQDGPGDPGLPTHQRNGMDPSGDALGDNTGNPNRQGRTQDNGVAYKRVAQAAAELGRKEDDDAAKGYAQAADFAGRQAVSRQEKGRQQGDKNRLSAKKYGRASGGRERRPQIDRHIAVAEQQSKQAQYLEFVPAKAELHPLIPGQGQEHEGRHPEPEGRGPKGRHIKDADLDRHERPAPDRAQQRRQRNCGQLQRPVVRMRTRSGGGAHDCSSRSTKWISTPPVLLGWIKATLEPRAPGRPFSSRTRKPLALTS